MITDRYTGEHRSSGSVCRRVTALAAAIALASCAQQSGTPAHVPAAAVEHGELQDLPPAPPGDPWLRCETKEEPGESQKVIHPGTADTLMLPRGHILRVPAGAVTGSDPVTITFQQLQSFRARVLIISHPHVVFGDSLTLTLSYAGRTCDAQTGDTFDIYREPSEKLPRPGGAGNNPPFTVSGRLNHFSTFAIAR